MPKPASRIRRYSKTILLVAIGLILVLGDFAVELLAPDFGEWMKRTLGGETRRNKLLIGALAVSIGVTILREHHAAKEEDHDHEHGAPGVPAPLFASDQDQENRQRMLKNVRSSWIEGVLHKSLWNEARILLKLTAKPEVVVRPSDWALRRAGVVGDTPIPAGTKIITVYEQEQEELLILGDPGSGKTTLLLEIAEELLNRAAGDPNYPIPVVFGLSAWRDDDKELAPWLVKQLNRDYGVPEKIGKRWVESGALLLLLDGLDEVAESRRARCVDAINAYRTKYQTVLRPMVVCCRTHEYETIPDLRLHGAVVIQPLSKAQVDVFLKEGGKELAGLRAVLKEEPELYLELFETPLMLNVAVVTYAGESAAALKSFTTSEERRKRLWNRYIEKAFERKSFHDNSSDKGRTILFISWLAVHMFKNNHNIFFIERLNGDVLSEKWKLILFRFTISLLLPLIALSAWPLKTNIYQKILLLMFMGAGSYSREIMLIPKLNMNLFRMNFSWMPVIIWTMCYSVGFTIFGLINDDFHPEKYSKKEVLVMFIIFFVVFLITNIMHFKLRAFSERGVMIRTAQNPNDGVKYTAKIAVIATLFTIFYFSVSGCLLFCIVYPAKGFVFGLGIGALLGFFAGALFYGGRACAQHYVLRILLWRSKRFPYRITPFLDSCTERILLQRVGGGWRFIHRSLQEHFAERYYEKHPEERPKTAVGEAGTA